MSNPQKQRWITAALKNVPIRERLERKEQGLDNPFHLAELYHENSKFRPDLMNPQNPYSTPDYREGTTERFWEAPAFSDLPPLAMTLGDTLRSRRSEWSFTEPISTDDLWLLLRYAVGATAERTVYAGKTPVELKLRSYPSGGALYPIQIYLFLHRVEGMPPGLYRFCPYWNRLYLLAEGADYLAEINALTPGTDPNANPLSARESYSEAAVFFFLAADFRHQADKYRLRAYRLTLLEAGHAAQNLCLVSTALGMAGVTLAGFYDDRANALFELDGVDRAMLYILPIGKKSEG